MRHARCVEREWLDELPAEDPRAVRSRRDLGRVNALMSNAPIVAGELRAFAGSLRRVAEIGAGDGTFALRLLRALPRPAAAAEIVLLDRQPVVSERVEKEIAELGWRAAWRRADVFEWLRSDDAGHCDAIVANLFLHHFEDGPLADLLQLAASRARLFVACEPRRSRLALLGSHLLGFIGCNDVTCHDAVVSVRAGFRGQDLSQLWPAAAAHVLRERPRGLFSHGFVARAP
ncbi:MAG TPA: methyltransferase domain-containing protein [Usitatibacter sp.]|nr:methyltransferase domain-containing protein [Usitatibacter sp.]